MRSECRRWVRGCTPSSHSTGKQDKDCVFEGEMIISHQWPLTHLVVDGIPDVDVGRVRDVHDRGVEVDDVPRLLLAVQVGVDLLDQRRLARTSHA